MASRDPNPNRTPMYPQIDPYSPSAPPVNTSSSSPSLYPTVEMNDLLVNLFPDSNQGISPRSQSQDFSPSAPPNSSEELLITIPGAILHLIDKQYSVELATGDLQIHCLYQGDNTIAILASVSDDIQWPLTKDLTAVKLDTSHYFFSFRAPYEADGSDSSDEDDKNKKKKTKTKKKKEKEENDVLSYGLTIVSKGQGQEGLLKELDEILETFSNFSEHKVEEKAAMAVVGATAGDITAGELKRDEKKMEEVEGQCAAYWTTLAPNVEEYSGTAARLIAKGSGQLVKGILWCGDVTVDRLKWGDEVLRQRMAPGDSKKELDPQTLKRIKRVKKVTKMTEKVATGVLSGVVKVSGYFTGSVANSRVGKKFFGMLPGEMVLASFDGFSRICDAAEIAGKNVMETSNTVTTGLVTHRYGEEAGKAASEGMEAAGHAVGTAWALFKIRQAVNPKAVFKPTALTKSAAQSLVAEKMAKKPK